MSKPNYIELGHKKTLVRMRILYEDRAVLAIDKMEGWLLIPFTWRDTARNLQAAITSSIAAGDFWARSRNLKSLQYCHRLDGDTSGILLFGKSHGAVESMSRLFEERTMEKKYLAVVAGVPKQTEWMREDKIEKDGGQIGRMRIDPQFGKDAETSFRVLETIERNGKPYTLVEARPRTGRTHQIRVHLAASGHSIVGDKIYGGQVAPILGLRAIYLGYEDPFRQVPVRIRADEDEFRREFGFPPRELIARVPREKLPEPAVAKTAAKPVARAHKKTAPPKV
ncbi:MAG: hypothetical protein RLZZ350_1289 [Verrucomicrobiota bacterium]|jgi:23S rRNA pseudouridine1911/1915/1917 synthase